jgi:hypothetical protein
MKGCLCCKLILMHAKIPLLWRLPRFCCSRQPPPPAGSAMARQALAASPYESCSNKKGSESSSSLRSFASLRPLGLDASTRRLARRGPQPPKQEKACGSLLGLRASILWWVSRSRMISYIGRRKHVDKQHKDASLYKNGQRESRRCVCWFHLTWPSQPDVIYTSLDEAT